MSRPLAQTRSALSANLICMASMLIWAIGLSAADLLTGPIPPVPLTGIRMGLSGAFLLAVWVAIEGWPPVRRAPWGKGVLIGGLGFAVGSFLMIVAQGLTNSVTVAVISATMPVMGIALECLFDGRKLHLALILGMLLSLAGGLMAYQTDGGLSFGLGAACAFGSVLAFTWGSRATVLAFPGLTPLGQTALTIGGAAVVTTVAALGHVALGGAGPDWSLIGWREVWAMLGFSIGSLALSQVLWIMAVGQLGIGMASLHINAAPFYVMIFAFALGGAWNMTQALGAAVVGLGVLIAQGVVRLPLRA